MKTPWPLAVLLLGAPAFAKPCPEGDVRVRAKTPVHRGPGLNYPVVQFLEQDGCARLEQVSVDARWTMLRLEASYGWVLTDRLDASGQEAAAAARPDAAPIGSGTERSFGQVVERSVLRERPQTGAPPRRVLPAGVRVLPLQLTADGAWVEVRDDRGDVGWMERAHLAGGTELPLASADVPGEIGLSEEALSAAAQDDAVRLARRRVGARDEGVHLTVGLFGAAVMPTQRFDSDGGPRNRRYGLSALSGAGSIEVQLTDMGPITARTGYTFGLIDGLATDDNPEQSAGGRMHDLVLRFGWPLALGSAVLTPELGYGLAVLDLDPALPGERQVTFVSTATHLGLAGVRFQLPFAERLLLEADAAFAMGSSSPGPGSLGSAGGLAVGGRGSAGVQYMANAAFGVTLRYALEGFSADWSGTGSFDRSLTWASVGELRQALLLGASFSI